MKVITKWTMQRIFKNYFEARCSFMLWTACCKIMQHFSLYFSWNERSFGWTLQSNKMHSWNRSIQGFRWSFLSQCKFIFLVLNKGYLLKSKVYYLIALQVEKSAGVVDTGCFMLKCSEGSTAVTIFMDTEVR